LQPEGGNLAIVDKSYFLHERDEKGQLKAITIEIEPGKEVKLIPLPEGELDQIGDPTKGYGILAAHIVEPKLTPDEIVNAGKNGAIARVVEKLFEISDIKESFRAGSNNKGKNP
jgi:hypothetical protein